MRSTCPGGRWGATVVNHSGVTVGTTVRGSRPAEPSATGNSATSATASAAPPAAARRATVGVGVPVAGPARRTHRWVASTAIPSMTDVESSVITMNRSGTMFRTTGTWRSTRRGHGGLRERPVERAHRGRPPGGRRGPEAQEGDPGEAGARTPAGHDRGEAQGDCAHPVPRLR